jgi:hypothetical protein
MLRLLSPYKSFVLFNFVGHILANIVKSLIRWIRLRMRNVPEKFVGRDTHFIFRNVFFPKIMPFVR